MSDPRDTLPTSSAPPARAWDEPDFGPPARAGEVGTLGRYRVLQKLGQGGMGAVYLGFHEALNRKVALKVMLPQYAAQPVARERFLREARAAAMVRSDHVVTIHDVDEANGVPFIAMERLLGLPLDHFLKTKGELPLPHVLRVCREVALGLAAAHDMGLIHRDIKPGNIWLEAPKGRVKLLDFGLARGPADEQLTGEGAVMGTPAYMSPEQGRGKKVDHRSDLFSLGTLLYRLCTGKMPFTGDGAMAVLTSLAVDTPTPPRELNPELPEAVEAVITRLLAKNPADRYQSAREVVAALAGAAADPLPRVVAVPVPPMAVGAQTQNVWEDVVDSGSVAVPLTAPAEATLTNAEEPTRPVRVGAAPRWPVALAAVAVLAAVGAVAAVALWPKKKPPEVAQTDPPAVPAPAPVVKPAPRPADADRKAAEALHPYAALRLSIPSRGQVGPLTAILFPHEPLPNEPFTLVGVVPQRGQLPLDRDVFFRAIKDLKSFQMIEDHYNVLKLMPADLMRLADGPAGPTLHTLVSKNIELSADLIPVLRRFPALVDIGLRGREIDDATLERLAAAFPQLEILTLFEFDAQNRVGPRGAKAVTGLARLHRLVLVRARNDFPQRIDREWSRLAGEMRSLVTLDLNGSRIDDADLADIARSPTLYGLNLRDTDVSDRGLVHLERVTTLRGVDVKGTKVTADGVNRLAKALPLCRIEYDGGVIDPSAADRKAAEWVLSVGGKVWLNGAALTAPSADLPREPFALTGINLDKNKAVTDDALAVFRDCTNLTHLNLSGTPVTDAGLAHFRGCRDLSFVSLWFTAVTDAGLDALKNCKALQTLQLYGTRVGDAELAPLKEATNLQYLDFTSTRVTDAGLANLKSCKKLRKIGLHKTDVTDAGLTHLKDCAELESITLRGTNVTAPGVAEFQRVHPGCEVDWDGAPAKK